MHSKFWHFLAKIKHRKTEGFPVQRIATMEINICDQFWIFAAFPEKCHKTSTCSTTSQSSDYFAANIKFLINKLL